MQLSVLMATNRKSLQTVARIAQACSWASPEIEVVVRDNSGDAEKRALIAQFARDNCKVVSVDPCDGPENFTEALKLATGDFIFNIGDDDQGFDHAVAAMPAIIDQFGGDPSVAGITGAYAVEGPQGTAVVAYQNIEAGEVAARVAGYLKFNAANVMVYAPVRRALLARVFTFINTMPVFLSYHDQISCLLYLLNGKFVRLPRLIYSYDVGPWAEAETAQQRDLHYYKAGGLDPVVNALHWFMCGFEGATLIRNGDMFPDYTAAERQAMTDQWFSVMFMRFMNNPRFTGGSSFAPQAEILCQKLRASQGRLSFSEMLADICHLMALGAPDKAQAYLTFWSAIMNRRNAAAAAR